MQLLTKGQWWSYRSTHWSQSGQWELRGGRMILQVRHHLYPLTVPGCIMHHCCPWTHHIYLRNQTRSGKQILLWKTSMFPSRCKYHISYIYHTFINLLFVLSEPLAFFAARPTPYWKRPQIFVQPLKTTRTNARITCRPQSNAWCTDEWQPQPVQSAAHFQAHHSLTKRPTHPPYPPFASDCNKWVYWKSCVGCLKIGHSQFQWIIIIIIGVPRQLWFLRVIIRETIPGISEPRSSFSSLSNLGLETAVGSYLLQLQDTPCSKADTHGCWKDWKKPIKRNKSNRLNFKGAIDMLIWSNWYWLTSPVLQNSGSGPAAKISCLRGIMPGSEQHVRHSNLKTGAGWKASAKPWEKMQKGHAMESRDMILNTYCNRYVIDYTCMVCHV